MTLLSELSDDDLMKRLQSGEADAFSVIVDRYQGMLIGFFIKNTRDVQLSEDLTQDTLLKIHKQNWDYLPLGRFKAWMFRIARNLLIDKYRRHQHDALVQAVKRKPDEEEDGIMRIAGAFEMPYENMQRGEFNQLIEEVLAEIPEMQRLTFTLHHIGGLSLSDVADSMEVSVATSKSRLRLAREKLAEKLRSRGLESIDHA